MKNTFKNITTILVGFILVGCADLDIQPLSELSSGNWFRDETEIRMSLYDLYRTDFLQIDEVFWDDDCLFRDSPQAITLGTMDSQNSIPSTRWTNCYKCINRALGIINGIEESAPDVSQEVLNQFLGEAYCFIGYSYGQLCTYFGDCVLIEGKITLEESFNMTRSPKADVMKYAYECFDKAAELLSADYPDNQVRFTKGAAYGFKARYAMQMGDYAIAVDACDKCMKLGKFDLDPNYKTMFTGTTSPEFIYYMKGDLSVPYGVGPFANVRNFTLRTLGAHTNRGPSYQLMCSFLCTDGLPIDESPLYNPKDPFENRDPRMAYTIQPFKTKYSKDYDEYMASRTDGTFETKYPEYLWGDLVEFTPNPYNTHVYDARKKTLVKTSDSKAANQHAVYTGLPISKFVRSDWQYFASYNLSYDNVYPYLRYAEILMNYCEAKNELGTITQEDLDNTINKVRERAYAGKSIAYPKVNKVDQAKLRTIIRMERRMEFAFENMRYRDLLRWRIMEKTQNTPQYYLNRAWSGSANWNGKTGDESNCSLSPEFMVLLKNWDDGNYPIGGVPPIDEDGLPDLTEMEQKGYITVFFQQGFDPAKNYLWPIPASEILVNPKLTQNPGY